jgi:hypothetical protein
VRLKDALVAKGYDVNYAWGIGVHSHDMGGAMLWGRIQDRSHSG